MKNETSSPPAIPTNPTTWAGDSVLIDLEKSATDPIIGSYQPITAAPTVGIDPDGNEWVFFGTGRYFIRDDKDITDQQTFYGIKEPRNASLKNTYAEVLRTKMYDSTSVEVNATTSLVTGGTWTDSPWGDFVNDTKAKAGWYYNFTSPERNLGQAALFGDLLFFTSYIPSNDICTYEGSSYLYALYYLTGTAPSHAVIHGSTTPTPTDNLLKRKFIGKGLASKPSIHIGKDGVELIDQLGDSSLFIEKVNTPGSTTSGRTSWGYR